MSPFLMEVDIPYFPVFWNSNILTMVRFLSLNPFARAFPVPDMLPLRKNGFQFP